MEEFNLKKNKHQQAHPHLLKQVNHESIHEDIDVRLFRSELDFISKPKELSIRDTKFMNDEDIKILETIGNNKDIEDISIDSAKEILETLQVNQLQNQKKIEDFQSKDMNIPHGESYREIKLYDNSVKSKIEENTSNEWTYKKRINQDDNLNEINSDRKVSFVNSSAALLPIFSQENFKSQIIKSEDISFVLHHINKIHSKKCNYSLLFSTDLKSSSALDFHYACDGLSPTLIIIKTTHDYKFGGYTQIKWNSDSRNEEDNCGFLFSINKQKLIFRDGGGNKYSSSSLNHHGPTFGSGHDLLISDNCTKNKNSYNFLKSSFGAFDSEVNKYYLANGDKYFQVDKYEVFKVLV